MNINQYNVANFLNKEWQDWLAINLANGVTAATLAQTLAQHGLIEASTALLVDFNLSYNVPKIALNKNYLSIDDRKIPILFSCQTPTVVVFDNFLSPNECEQLIQCADSKFQTATVVNAQTGEYFVTNERTSMNATFARGENTIIATLEHRIAQALNWPIENGEGLQILRYQTGGEYKPHFDYFDISQPGGLKATEIGGQRVGTFLTYLSDIESGGATRFPAINFEIRPKAGMGLYFANMTVAGQPEPLSLHSSVPVISGTKYIATKWIRERQYGSSE